jgi:hypothetical protein
MLNLNYCTANARLKNLGRRVVCTVEIDQFDQVEKDKVLLQDKLRQLPESDIDKKIMRRIEVRSAYSLCK